MPRELLMQNNYEWVTAEGQTLEIENAIRSNARDLKIEGQTYQDVFVNRPNSGTDSDYAFKPDGVTFVLKGVNSNRHFNVKDKSSYMLKTGTYYTYVVNIIRNNNTEEVGLYFNTSYQNEISYFTTSHIVNVPKGFTGTLKFLTETKTDFSSVTVADRNYLGTNGKTLDIDIKFNYYILEGNYTNIELPTSINGIESVAEREKESNLYPVKIADKAIKNVHELKLDSNYDFTNLVTWGPAPIDTSLTRINFKLTYPYATILGNNNSVTSNMFPYLYIHDLPGGSIAVRQECVSNHSEEQDKINVIIKKSRLSSVTTDGVKKWCIANNFKILYRLATPITESSTTTEIPLPQPLRSLPNGVCDTIEGNKLTQKIYKYIINNNTVGYIENETTDFLRIHYGNVLPLDKGTVIPEKNGISNIMYQANHSNTFEHIYVTGISAWIFLPKSKLSSNTMDGVKSYLSNNPITVYYSLQTPIEHTINIPPISISKGSNTITTTNNIKPDLSIEYKKAKK